MAAVLAMLGSKGKQGETAENDVEAKPAPHVAQPDSSDSCEITSPGAEHHPGDDLVSQFGASKPQQAAGSQVLACQCSKCTHASQHCCCVQQCQCI